MSQSTREDADDILHWLNAHSVQVSDGVSASLLQQKWLVTDRDLTRLRAALEWLFAEQLVALTPDFDPPHVRFTAAGFVRLLAAFDHARVPSPISRELRASVIAMPTPQPEQDDETRVTAAPTLLNIAPPKRFLVAGKAPTEMGLRNQILLIYRDLKVTAGNQVIAMTLSRYWQEMGLRGGDLRTGIDVLVHDGYLKHAVHRFENHWMLTAAGEAFMLAPVTPLSLLLLAEPMDSVFEGPSDDDLRRQLIMIFSLGDTRRRPFAALLTEWMHGRDALLHATDLCWKSGLLTLHEDGPLAIALTARGQEFREQAESGWSRFAARLLGR